MAQKNKSIKLTIQTETKDIGKIDSLIKKLGDMGVEVADVTDEASDLKKELDSIGRKSGAIEQFESINRIIDATSQELEQARNEATRLGKEFSDAARPTKKLTGEFERASEKVRSLKRRLNEEREALRAAGNSAKAAGVDTKRLTAEKVRLSAQAAIAAEKTRVLKNGLSKLDNEMRKGGKSAKSMREGLSSISTQLSRLQKLAGAFYIGKGFAHSVGDLAKVADTYKLLQGRIELVSDSQEEFNAAQAETSQIAKDTRTGLEDVVSLYTRLRFVQKDQNVAQEDTLKLTRLMTQAMKVSGASQAESAATLTQLTQAFSSGVLRGEEFNSMMEQGPRLAKALADGLGVPVSALRSMAEEGEITADKLGNALLSQSAVIAEEYRTLPQTVGGALTNINTSWLEYVGKVNDATGASKIAVEALNSLANNLDAVVESIAKLAGAGLTVLLGKWVIGLRAAVVEMIAMRTATTGMGAASAAASVQVQKLSKVMKAAGWIGVAIAVKELTENLWDLYETYDQVNTAIKQQQDNQEKLSNKISRYLTDYQRWADLQIKSEQEIASLSEHRASEYEKQLLAAGQYWMALSMQLKQQGKDFTEAEQKSQQYFGALEKYRAAVKALAEEQKELANSTASVDAENAKLASSYITQIQNAKTVGEVAAATSAAMRGLAGNTKAQALVSQAAADKVSQLDKAQAEAAKSAAALAKEQDALKKVTVEVTDSIDKNYEAMLRLQTQYDEGKISAGQFNAGVSALSEKNTELRDKQREVNKEVETNTRVTKRASDATEKQNASLGNAISLTHVIRKRYAELSDAAAAYFDQMMAGVNSIEQWWTVLSDRRFEQTRANFDRLIQANDALIQRLRDGAASAEDMASAQSALAFNTNAVAHGMLALGEEQLEPLRAALADAQSRMDALRDSAESSLVSLSNELDRLNGNMAAIEQRNYEQKRLDLQQKLAEAQAAGDQAAIAALQKSLAILEKIHKIKMANINADKASASLASGRGAATTSGEETGEAASGDQQVRGSISGSFAGQRAASGRHVIELRDNRGNSTEISVTDEEQAYKFMDAIERAGLTSL